MVDQERDLVSQQKRINTEKLKNQEMKIKTLNSQLQEAKVAIIKIKEKNQERDQDLNNLSLSKLVTAEKNLEELKTMYQNLLSSKESVKKDLFVLDKKYKKQ